MSAALTLETERPHKFWILWCRTPGAYRVMRGTCSTAAASRKLSLVRDVKRPAVKGLRGLWISRLRNRASSRQLSIKKKKEEEENC